ncbi:hypothetical protein GCM10023354_22820 [Garicola koreensis]
MDVVGGVHHRLRIVLNQLRGVLGVDVVSVLVSDQHSIETFEVVPQVGERSRIHQNPCSRSFDQNGRMTKMCDPHSDMLTTDP